MQTAQATLALLSSLKEADKDAVIQVLTAHYRHVCRGHARGRAQAAEQGMALENAAWEPFERLSHMSAERVPRAQRPGGDGQRLANAGRTCGPPGQGVKEAQLEAFKMLTDAVEPAAPAAPRGCRAPLSVAPGCKA